MLYGPRSRRVSRSNNIPVPSNQQCCQLAEESSRCAPARLPFHEAFAAASWASCRPNVPRGSPASPNPEVVPTEPPDGGPRGQLNLTREECRAGLRPRCWKRPRRFEQPSSASIAQGVRMPFRQHPNSGARTIPIYRLPLASRRPSPVPRLLAEDLALAWSRPSRSILRVSNSFRGLPILAPEPGGEDRHHTLGRRQGVTVVGRPLALDMAISTTRSDQQQSRDDHNLTIHRLTQDARFRSSRRASPSTEAARKTQLIAGYCGTPLQHPP